MKQSALDKRLLEQAAETYARNVDQVAGYLEGQGDLIVANHFSGGVIAGPNIAGGA